MSSFGGMIYGVHEIQVQVAGDVGGRIQSAGPGAGGACLEQDDGFVAARSLLTIGIPP